MGTYQRFLPVFAKEVLGVGPKGLGIMMAAPGAGAILSLIFLGSVGEELRRETLLWVTAMLTPVFLVVFCLSRSFSLSVVVLALVGGPHITFRTVSRVIIQMRVPANLLGRVMSVFLMDQGMRSIGSLVIGSSIWRRARARTHVDRLFDPHFGSISSPSRTGLIEFGWTGLKMGVSLRGPPAATPKVPLSTTKRI